MLFVWEVYRLLGEDVFQQGGEGVHIGHCRGAEAEVKRRVRQEKPYMYKDL